MRNHFVILGGAASLLAMSCSRTVPIVAVGNAPGSPFPAAYGKTVEQGISRIRTATAAFHDLDSAEAAGYPRQVARCLANPGVGGMGHHHANRKYYNLPIALERPQILLYAPDSSDKYTLNGVEYIVPYRLWPEDSIPPAIMGRNLAKSDVSQVWYLHVWAWKPNPAGLFADWNPAVHCHSK